MQPQEQVTNNNRTSWVIDPTHSTVEFTIKKLYFFTVKGSLTKVSGTIVIDPTDVRSSSAAVVLQSASIDTGNSGRDQQLRAPGFLDAARYPEIRFESTKVEPGTDRDTLRVTGTLSIKDQSKEIVLEVSEIDRSRSPNGEYVAYYSAVTNIDRLDFRVDAMRLLIGRKVQIMISLQATRPI